MLSIQPQELNRDRLQAYYAKKNYVFFDGGDFDLNIIGVRNKVPEVNKFNDVITCVWREGGEWQQKVWPATTDPGLYFLQNPLVVEGTAILCPGQYRSSHALGTHRDYPALIQVGSMTVWRDGNRNSLVDFDKSKTYSGYFGINIHRALPVGVTAEVNQASAGCSVFQSVDDFHTFMALVFKASTIWGSTFSYTLIEQSDLDALVPMV
jgi:hypothetical protein